VTASVSDPSKPSSPSDGARCANLLGALSLVLVDQTTDAATAVSGHASSDAAALSALYQFLDRPSVDRLRQVLGLTSSGTVRLVDRLAQQGLVRREAGADARSSVVVLTAAGRAVASRLSAGRAAVLTASLAVLDDDERATLEALIGKVLVGRMRGPGATRWICRLCDLGACGRADDACPVANAARERYG
jgi:DNA-binding MarR family transcriptional regulator